MASAEFLFSGLKTKSSYLSKIAVPGLLCYCLLDFYLNHLKSYLSEKARRWIQEF